MTTIPEILTRLDRKADEDHALIKALISATRAQFNANGDDDQWTLLPSKNLRCSITGANRSYINTLRKNKKIRSKSVNGRVHFSANDFRNLKDDKDQA